MTKTLEERAEWAKEILDNMAITGELSYETIDDLLDCIEKQQARIKELEAQKDGAYSERNQLVAALSKLLPAWMERHSEEDTAWDNDWRNIVFIGLPTGQVSWHIHDSEIDHFQHLTKKAGSSWDGHTTEEKYRRLAALPEKKIPYLEELMNQQRERMHDLAMRIHHAKEVYIGMDGFKPETAPEGYCLKLLKEMYDELKEEDNAKNTDNVKYHSYDLTEAEIEAAGRGMYYR